MKPGFPVLRARVEELAEGAATVLELPHGNRTLAFTRLDKRHMPAFGHTEQEELMPPAQISVTQARTCCPSCLQK